VQAKIQIQKIENLNAFFKLLAEEGVKVVNIGSQGMGCMRMCVLHHCLLFHSLRVCV